LEPAQRIDILTGTVTGKSHMSKSAQAIESATLLLPPEERARLAERLIASLEEREPEVEAAWAAEIRRRMDEWEAGLLDEIPWDEARRQIEQRLKRR
jgi:putative addiction module component (TIGR02574 family)